MIVRPCSIQRYKKQTNQNRRKDHKTVYKFSTATFGLVESNPHPLHTTLCTKMSKYFRILRAC